MKKDYWKQKILNLSKIFLTILLIMPLLFCIGLYVQKYNNTIKNIFVQCELNHPDYIRVYYDNGAGFSDLQSRYYFFSYTGKTVITERHVKKSKSVRIELHSKSKQDNLEYRMKIYYKGRQCNPHFLEHTTFYNAKATFLEDNTIVLKYEPQEEHSNFKNIVLDYTIDSSSMSNYILTKKISWYQYNYIIANYKKYFLLLCICFFLFLLCFSPVQKMLYIKIIYLFKNNKLLKLYKIAIELKKDPNSFIEKQLKKITLEEWIHYISLTIFIIILCIMHFYPIPGGDDTRCFNHALKNTSYLDFLKIRYNTWSSRLLIESVLINCYELNFSIWRFFDVVACVLIAECMISICFINKKYAVFVYSILLFFIDYHSLHNTGWGATTVNYVWPLSTSLLSFVIIKQIFMGKQLNKITVIISILLLLFAVNHEQVVALIFGLNISFLIFRILQNRKFQKADLYFILVIIICIISIIFIFTCPGNAIRYEKEVKYWFPEYTMLSLLDKLQIGLLTILTYYFSFSKGMSIIIPLYFILTLIFFKKNKKLFLLQLVLNLFLLFLFFGEKNPKFWLLNNKISQFSGYSQLIIYTECLIIIVISLILLYQVYAVMKNKLQGLLNIFLLCAGFCSAFILAFSPTVYASGSRCYIFMSSIIFIVTFRIFNDYLIQKSLLKNLSI